MALKKTQDQFLVELNQYNQRNAPRCVTTSDSYVNLSTPMTFTCSTCDNQFLTLPRHILIRNSGCPSCSTLKVAASNSVPVDRFLSQLTVRNTTHSQISYVSGFVGMTKEATFKCETCSHQWSTLPKTIVRGSGCPICARAATGKNQLLSRAEFQERLQHRNTITNEQITLARNSVYMGGEVKIEFSCVQGHTWITRPNDVINNHSGCPHCAGTVSRNAESALAEIHDKWPLLTICSQHTTLLGRREKLEVQCEHHHTWTTHYERLMNGHYCPHCHGNAKYNDGTFRLKIQQVNPKIEVLGTYISATIPIEIKCVTCAHEWKSRPYNLINGYGCPKCSKNNKFSKKALAWLKYTAKVGNIEIQHAQHYGEYRIPGTRYRCDGYAPSTNTVYEFYGDYWHGNPTTTDAASYNIHLSKTFGELYQKTIDREDQIRKLGFNLVSMWESDYDKIAADSFLMQVASNFDLTNFDVSSYNQTVVELQNDTTYIAILNINHPPDADVRYSTMEYLNKGKILDKKAFILFSDELEQDATLVGKKLAHYAHANSALKINGRDCVIRVPTKDEKRALLNANHVQGNDNAQISYAAYYKDKIVAIMTFTAPRVALGQKGTDVDRTGMWELSRFCTDTMYRIPGIASKLLTHFKRNHQWVEIYSYADKRWSIGNMYTTLGFTQIADNIPDYFYVVAGSRKHRWNYRKDILKTKLEHYDPTLTEYKNMMNHGYYRIWDCGTLKFQIKNSAYIGKI